MGHFKTVRATIHREWAVEGLPSEIMYHNGAGVIDPTASTIDAFAPRPARAARRFALLWLVLALLFQGFVTQTHAHAAVDREWAATRSVVAAAAVDDRKQGPATPACPLCEEKALFGAYLLGGSVTVAAPIDAAFTYVVASLPLFALGTSSHAWRSRAPPVFTA